MFKIIDGANSEEDGAAARKCTGCSQIYVHLKQDHIHVWLELLQFFKMHCSTEAKIQEISASTSRAHTLAAGVNHTVLLMPQGHYLCPRLVRKKWSQGEFIKDMNTAWEPQNKKVSGQTSFESPIHSHGSLSSPKYCTPRLSHCQESLTSNFRRKDERRWWR